MNIPEKAASLEGAYDDLLRRSLSKIPGDMGRLIYLASTRDYNTATYHHEGLAARYRSDLAGKALECAHRDVFHRLSICSLRQLVKELETYINCSPQSREEMLHVWQKLEPYRVAIPMDVNLVVARLFVSNVRLALAILQQAQERASR